MSYYLVKTEPSEYSFAQLQAAGVKGALWDGVSNNTALIHLRAMVAGDDVYIYHTGDERAVVGIAKVISGAVEDLARPGLTLEGKPKFAVVRLAAVRAAKTSFALAAMKADPLFAEFILLKQSRLSVMPVPAPLAKRIDKAIGV